MSDDDLEDRVEALEEALESVRDSQSAYRDQIVKPRLDGLEDTRDDAREERAELKETVQTLEQEVAGLRAELRSIAGVGESEDTSPDKRVADLRQAMIRRAKARTDGGQGYTSLWWQEVQNLFADLGHGEICKPDCYKAMREGAKGTGFEMGSTHNSDGREVKAICLNVDELPALDASRTPTTGEKVSTGQESAVEGVKGKSD